MTPTVYTRPCIWCSLYRPGKLANVITVLAEHSDGLCPECSAKGREAIGQAVRERAGRRLLAEMYHTSASIVVLLPFLKNQCDLGWPGVNEHDRSDYTDALADLRASVGDR